MTTDEILRLAESGLGEDPDGYRYGFLEMVDAYRVITEATEEDGSLR
jgi:hypothetical protein